VKVVDDIKAFSNPSELDKFMISNGMLSYINVPAMDLDGLIGTLCLISDRPKGFSDEDIEIAHKIADMLAVVIQRKRGNDALRESEKQYRNLVDNSLVGVYRTNLNGDIIYINRALSDMLEYESPEELQNEGVISRYQNKEDRKSLIDKLNKTEKVDNIEFQLLTKTGKTKNALLSARLEGEFISGMILDITKQRKAEKATKASELFLSSILESIQDGVVVLDREYKILYTNDSYIQQTATPSDIIRGKYCFEVSYSREEPCFAEGLDCSVKNVFETGMNSREVRKKADKYMEMTAESSFRRSHIGC
jgi:PAS domain S-box-containing protein